MTTGCNPASLDFPRLGPRDVRADFDGGAIPSGDGALLLREAERLTGIFHQFTARFTDPRNPDLTEYSVEELIARRVCALALGYSTVLPQAGHPPLPADLSLPAGRPGSASRSPRGALGAEV